MSVPASASPDPIRLDDAERLARLRLIRSDNIGPITFRELLAHFGSAVAALDEVAELAARGGRRIRLCREAEAETELAAIERMGAQLVVSGEDDYPAWLAHIDDAPPLLTVRGDLSLLKRPAVAIVGSRNASLSGCKFARMMAHDLGESGYTVVSGLARGIDAAAHEAALSTGTVAVLAGGLDRIYPPQHIDLAETIVHKGGILATEMPIGWEPKARDFPRRNRIVSGMSLAVVVVEAAHRSGSLITARMANEQGRLVFAVPGSPLDPRSAGANRLIRDGAHIVTGVEDILAELEPMVSRPSAIPLQIGETADDEDYESDGPNDNTRSQIIAALGPAPVEIDEICRFSGIGPATVHLVLLELDLAGRLTRHPGGRVSLNL